MRDTLLLLLFYTSGITVDAYELKLQSRGQWESHIPILARSSQPFTTRTRVGPSIVRRDSTSNLLARATHEINLLRRSGRGSAISGSPPKQSGAAKDAAAVIKPGFVKQRMSELAQKASSQDPLPVIPSSRNAALGQKASNIFQPRPRSRSPSPIKGLDLDRGSPNDSARSTPTGSPPSTPRGTKRSPSPFPSPSKNTSKASPPGSPIRQSSNSDAFGSLFPAGSGTSLGRSQSRDSLTSPVPASPDRRRPRKQTKQSEPGAEGADQAPVSSGRTTSLLSLMREDHPEPPPLSLQELLE